MTNVTRELVKKTIQESDSLITALESVAAMYNIPSENIIVDDRMKNIRVTGDSITAPDLPNPSANTKSIVCAIGAVLDNISQRVDKKLDAYQASTVQTNKSLASQKTPNPAKGEVIGRYFDDNNDEIIVYASGLVDMENTPEALRKVEELRKNNQIPDYVQEPEQSESSSYFTKEDDIMNNVPAVDKTKFDLQKATNNIALQIHESADIMDMIDQFHGTTHLGYELLQSQGFDYVKETNAYVQEAAESSSAPTAVDLQHMRFDNTNLMKAIRCFNDARAEFASQSKVALRDIARNAKFQEGIKYIEKQFDCHLAIRFMDVKDDNGKDVTDAFTQTIEEGEIKQDITISKSKGFQLHGTPIQIFFAGEIFNMDFAKRGQELFGQYVLSIILHEIWHNIASTIRSQNDQFIFTLSSAIQAATATSEVKTRRVILTNAVNAMSSLSDKKISKFQKKKLVKQLLVLTETQYNAAQIESLKNKIKNAGANELEDIDAYIKELQKLVDLAKYEAKPRKVGPVKRTVNVITGLIGLVIGVALACTIILAPLGFIIGAIGVGSLTDKSGDTPYGKKLKEFLSKTDKEEYYADLFAAMYNLPIAFDVGPFKNRINPSKLDKERLQKLTELEREASKYMFDPHPTDEQRSYAAMKIARALLDSGEKLEPEIKKYCEWIVENYKVLEDTDVAEIFNEKIFDPKEADDLDEHLRNIVSNNNIVVTEQSTSRISRPRRF